MLLDLRNYMEKEVGGMCSEFTINFGLLYRF
ncbi:hypothetical protein M6B38_357135 [Iris pallida]|uniref:Uncharacterized protein n=1 Tax=Iris pallida TaxID=29817 RepID=A0AAX6GM36_IRIPA|nr:hypothetical protein M6B38_357135 [Iris pallida]